MSQQSLYEFLGVARDASRDEIVRVYHARARESHPDLSGNPRTAELFQRLTEAYSVLSDPDRRRAYDAELAPRPWVTVVRVRGGRMIAPIRRRDPWEEFIERFFEDFLRA